MKMAVFWDVALRSLVHTDRRFRDAYCLHYHKLKLETSKMWRGDKETNRIKRRETNIKKKTETSSP
jgi:hypothetical protein